MNLFKEKKNKNPLEFTIYPSISNVPSADWDQIVDSQDVSMNKNLILLTEASLKDQANFWTIVIRLNQEPIAVACICLFRTDIFQSAPNVIQKLVKQLRTIKKNAFQLSVLFCGLPVPCGQIHFRVKDDTLTSSVLKTLNQIMQKLAKKEKATLIVFKEFTQTQLFDSHCLQKEGFISGSVPPLYEIKGNYSSFQAYSSLMRHKYRRQVHENQKKFNLENIKIERITEPQKIHNAFTKEVHQLYLEVWEKSKEKLEQFPQSFFQGLGFALPQQTALILIYEKDKPIAFTVGIHNQTYYYNLYCGINYEQKERLDLYFNLYYAELDQVFKQNIPTICLGQTSDSFKSRLGALACPRFFLVRAKNKLLQKGLKFFRHFIFPNPSAIPSHRVFKTND